MGLRERRMFLLILALHFITSLAFIADLDTTMDESDYFGYTTRWAHGDTERTGKLDDSKTPVTAPALAPLLIRKYWPDDTDPYGFRFLHAGRMFMYGYLVLLAFSFLFILRNIWPRSPAWPLPLVLLLYDPMIFSYSALVGSDLPVASLLLAALYNFWQYSRKRRSKHFWFFVIFSTGCIVAKASMIYWLPMLLMMWTGLIILKREAFTWRTEWKKMVICLATIFLVINAAYWFNRSFFPLGEMPQKSALFQHIHQLLKPLHGVPVPLPYDYVSAFDELKLHAAWGGSPYRGDEATFMGVYLHGQLYESGPFWYYYLHGLLFKLPLLTFLLVALSAILIWKMKKWRFLNSRLALIYLPPLLFFAIVSLTNPFNIGLRHILFAYPLIYLFTVPAIRWLLKFNKWLMPALVILQFVSFAIFWPNMISYTNELLQPKRRAYYHFGDSTINYGHIEKYQEEYLQKHPEYKRLTAEPAPGKYAVEFALIYNPRHFPVSWWIKQFKPAGLYRHSVLLYEITDEDIRHIDHSKRPAH